MIFLIFMLYELASVSTQLLISEERGNSLMSLLKLISSDMYFCLHIDLRLFASKILLMLVFKTKTLASAFWC